MRYLIIFLLVTAGCKQSPSPQQEKVLFFHFDEMPFETLSPNTQRKMVNGKNITFSEFRFAEGTQIPQHHHKNEQIIYVIQGSLKVIFDGETYVMNQGDLCLIPPERAHSFEALEETLCLQIFSPIRKDWINGEDVYLRYGSLQKLEQNDPSHLLSCLPSLLP